MSTSPKKILLGLTGGIAAYKAAELTRLLVKQGLDVQVVMTASARQFITPTTLQALSGKPVLTELWDNHGNGMAHIDLARSAEMIVIAPASANFIAKLAHGVADDLLSTLCLARGKCPLLVAPAMNVEMWQHPATQRNIKQLAADGVVLLGPDSGSQACGETGMGRMLEAETLAQEIHAQLQPKLLAGRKILITAGATFEAIDPVRGLTNASSGKMGYAIATEALAMGAAVTLVSGPVALQAPNKAHLIRITSARQMLDAVLKNIQGVDIFIGVAAVADYTPALPSAQKLKKNGQNLTLELTPTQDILATVASLPNSPFCVGFAAESENLLEFAGQKRQRKNIPLLVANLVQDAFGTDDTTVTLLDDTGAHPLPRASKQVIANQLLQHVARMLP